MKKGNILWLPLIMLPLVLAMGCSKHFVITEELAAPLNRGASCSIGEIIDALPFDFEADKKPTTENIEKFKGYLAEALKRKELFGEIDVDFSTAEYEVTGSILDYEKGSGFIRFLFGSGIGSAKVTMSLQLVRKGTAMVIFSGNFIGTVSSGWEKGDKMFEFVAKKFAGELNKELEKLEREE